MPMISAALTCVVLHGLAPGRPQTSEAFGFIADVTGRWEIVHGSAKPTPAERRAVLRTGDVLQKLDDDALSLIAVATYAGTMEKYRQTTYLTARPVPGTLTRIMTVIQQRFQEGWINASVRGGSDFSDAVVKAGSDRLDLSAVFNGAADGAYSLAIYAIAGGKLTAPAQATAVVATTRKPITIAALPPGLYQIDVTGAEPGAAGNAWIRVVPAAQFDQVSSDFMRLPGADGGARAELRKAARAIARTYLIILSDSTPPKG